LTKGEGEMTTADFGATIYPWIVAGLGGFVGAALLLPTKLGEAIFSYRLGKALEGFKAEQSRELERLKEQLSHVGDRGKRSNEKEYDALSETWNQFVDVLSLTERAIAQFVEFPDLNRADETDAKRFLDSTDLSEQQREDVLRAADKNSAYSGSVRWLAIAKAHNQIFEFRASLKKRSIFIPGSLVSQFEEAVEFCSKAEVTEAMRFRNPNSSIGFDASLAFLRDKEKVFSALRDLTRERLLRNLES
jgi:hypothetical protein